MPPLTAPRILAFASGLALAAGVVLPAVHVPIFGTQSLVEADAVPAFVLLALGIACVGATVLARPWLPRLLAGAGAVALALVAWVSWSLTRTPRGDAVETAVGRIVQGLGAAIELTWGIAVLVAAALGLLAAGLWLGARRA